MATLPQIFEWFRAGKNPTESQFRDTWQSFWHKSEKIPQTQVFGLENSLNNVSVGMIYRPPVAGVADLATTYPAPVKGWSVKVQSTGYIYQYDGADWNDTGLTAYPGNVATKDETIQLEREINGTFTYAGALNYDGSINSTGVFISTGYQLIDKTRDIEFVIDYLPNYTSVDYLTFFDKLQKRIGKLSVELLNTWFAPVTVTSNLIPADAVYYRIATTVANKAKSYVRNLSVSGAFASQYKIVNDFKIKVGDRPNPVWMNGRINADGSFTSTTGVRCTDFYEVKSRNIELKSPLASIHYCWCYDSGKNPLSIIYSSVNNNNLLKMTLPDSAVYVRLSAFPNESGVEFTYAELIWERKITYPEYEDHIGEFNSIKAKTDRLEVLSAENIAPSDLLNRGIVTNEDTSKVLISRTKIAFNQFINNRLVPYCTRLKGTVVDGSTNFSFTPNFRPDDMASIADGCMVTFRFLMRKSAAVTNLQMYNFGMYTLAWDVSLPAVTDEFFPVSQTGILSSGLSARNQGIRLYSVIPAGTESFYIDIAAFSVTVESPENIDFPYPEAKEDFVTKKEMQDAISSIGGNSDRNANMIGIGLQRLYAKLWSKSKGWDDIYKQDEIRIVSFADSIGNSIGEGNFNSVLSYAFPSVTFKWMFVNYGGSGPQHMLAKAREAIMFNPDLVLCGEWETYSTDFKDQQPLDTLIMLFREYSQADIALWAHSLRRESTDLLEAGDIDGYLDSYTHKIRCMYMAYSHKYGCEFMDLQQPLLVQLITGEKTSDDLFANSMDVVHPSPYTVGIFVEQMKKHFPAMWNNENIANNICGRYQTTHLLSEAVVLADMSAIRLTGNASFEQTTASRSGNLIKCETGSTLEWNMEGVTGCEITTFGKYTGAYEVYINGEPARNLIKDYTTCTDADFFARIHKAVIIENILADSEVGKYFKFVITSVDFSGAGIGYDLYQGNMLVGSGNTNGDGSFGYNGGIISVPAYYGFTRNWRSGEYDTNYPPPSNIVAIKVGDVYDFKVMRGTQNLVTVTNNNQTERNELVGLKKGSYSIRVEVVSGAVCFDSYMEY
ncbi:MAG: hypothetical protein LBJ01_08135 [Tannerella sp.]|jgi:hypothetical protein|nr:hypothetical protein [Tannerella sp.]